MAFFQDNLCKLIQGQTIWILVKQETMWRQWHQLDHMHIIIYTSIQTDNHASISLITQFYTGQMLFLLPNQQCQSTDCNASAGPCSPQQS